MVAYYDFLRGDQDKLDAMLEIFSRSAGHTITIEDLVTRWTAFVDELEARREWSASEYEEGLELREMLEEVSECLSEHGRQALIQALLRPDRLFLSLTLPVHGALSCAWWKRYPRSMVHKLHGGAIPLSNVALRSSRLVQAR